MSQRFDQEALERQLLRELALVGTARAPELQRLLGISQPVFSRVTARISGQLLIVGQGRATRYAARREFDASLDRVPVYQIDDAGRASWVAVLHAILPRGFYVDSATDDLPSGFHRDLPYFLNELRPAGFLGRLIPAQHPELELPSDVRLWSADHTLRYLSRFGWNMPGNLIVGDGAFERYVAHAQDKQSGVAAAARSRQYPRLATSTLAAGAPGSSAGGEQPKFLTHKLPDGTAVLVKFSPQESNAISRRRADLLVCEHLAHQTLTSHGRLAAASEILTVKGRTFLEVARFDRTSAGGRKGVLSLLALDAEFVGHLRTWTESVERLAEQHILNPELVDQVRWLELFGRLIANSDMHAGNLSFFVRGSQVLSLAPAYDMMPALYAGQQEHLGQPAFELPRLTPGDASIWDSASRAALDFWRDVTKDTRISPSFRKIARANRAKVDAWRKGGLLLPR